MNNQEPNSKPENAEQESGKGLDETPCSASFAAWLHDYFRAMRFDKARHLGLGDIRLTMGQQDDLVVAAERAYLGKPNSVLSEPKTQDK
jgi:hypothetical protein